MLNVQTDPCELADYDEEKRMERKRNKTPDDQSTIVADKPATTAGYVVFRSFRPEPREFEVMNVRARRNAQYPDFCEWWVPSDKADDFAKQFHVQRGRIVRV